VRTRGRDSCADLIFTASGDDDRIMGGYDELHLRKRVPKEGHDLLLPEGMQMGVDLVDYDDPTTLRNLGDFVVP
jgi:hypothetical protein